MSQKLTEIYQKIAMHLHKKLYLNYFILAEDKPLYSYYRNLNLLRHLYPKLLGWLELPDHQCFTDIKLFSEALVI